ncbi:DUF222 domain-containing protein [Actinotalea ferrariae]|uniref:HNH endonuclease signature motif containing protein n=1 Tax=Actinotalea ferrariae TaxID=1386098 RepID=UPI001C8BAAD8|nr:HNH endonuclease signature motif containing protein [Actinotalea ferrariae]MBX9243297.1 DUF222 domain-containing protein [Actinotalea ferrariae]
MRATRVAAATPAAQIGAAADDVVADVARLVARVRGAGGAAGDWTPVQRRAVLSALDGAIGALTVVRGDVLVAERDSGTWRASGDPSFEAWRGRTSRAGTRAALTQVRQAETATQLPRLGDAVRDGALPVQHMEVLSRVVAAAPAPVRAALASEDHQAELLGVARRVDAGTFAKAAQRLAARLDPRAHERGHQAQRAARYLHLSDAVDGTRISGLVDHMAGHRLRLALEAVTPRPTQDDERTNEQRRADALDTLAEKVLSLPQTGSGAAVRPHVSFLMDADTWAALRAQRQAEVDAAARARSDAQSEAMVSDAQSEAAEVDSTQSGSTGSESTGSESTPPDLARGFEPVTLEDGTPVPLSEVARALCDCELTRIVLDADGVPLDIGRSRRTYTGAQRRAVIARDRTCVWPDCTGDARWGEVHHIRWWDRDDGPTSLENAALLCSFHHHEVHRRDLSITRHPPPPRPPGRARETKPAGGRAGKTEPAPQAGSAGRSHRNRRSRTRPLYSFHDPRGRPVAIPRTVDEATPDAGAALLP